MNESPSSSTGNTASSVAGNSASSFAGTRFLTVQEVAQQMRVSAMTIYRLIKAGDLPAVRVGRSFRVREDDIDRYLSASFHQAG